MNNCMMSSAGYRYDMSLDERLKHMVKYPVICTIIGAQKFIFKLPRPLANVRAIELVDFDGVFDFDHNGDGDVITPPLFIKFGPTDEGSRSYVMSTWTSAKIELGINAMLLTTAKAGDPPEIFDVRLQSLIEPLNRPMVNEITVEFFDNEVSPYILKDYLTLCFNLYIDF